MLLEHNVSSKLIVQMKDHIMNHLLEIVNIAMDHLLWMKLKQIVLNVDKHITLIENISTANHALLVK
jgi:hypothetical protein